MIPPRSFVNERPDIASHSGRDYWLLRNSSIDDWPLS